jgi:hypothetical protein
VDPEWPQIYTRQVFNEEQRCVRMQQMNCKIMMFGEAVLIVFTMVLVGTFSA